MKTFAITYYEVTGIISDEPYCMVPVHFLIRRSQTISFFRMRVQSPTTEVANFLLDTYVCNILSRICHAVPVLY